MIVTQDTKRIAQQALDYILEHPERHDQSAWVMWPEMDRLGLLDYTGSETPLCNTTMCVAGTVQWQQEGMVAVNDCDKVAGNYLGLSESEYCALFFDTNNDMAVRALTAIANGDKTKFRELLNDYIITWDDECCSYDTEDTERLP